MKFNHDKSNYIVFSRSKEKISRRINLGNDKLDRVTETKMVGLWLTEDLNWAKTTRSYFRVSLLATLKYSLLQRTPWRGHYFFLRSKPGRGYPPPAWISEKNYVNVRVWTMTCLPGGGYPRRARITMPRSSL